MNKNKYYLTSSLFVLLCSLFLFSIFYKKMVNRETNNDSTIQSYASENAKNNENIEITNRNVSIYVDNSTCKKIVVAWQSDSNNSAEYNVWRSDIGLAGSFNKVSPDLKSQTLTWSDLPPKTNQTYYYQLRLAENDKRTISNIASALNQSCSADLINSSHFLAFINNEEYSQGRILANGDKVTFQTTIVNNGASSATVDSMDIYLSSTLTLVRDLQIDKNGNGIFNEVLAGETGFVTTDGSKFSLIIGGIKTHGGPNWIVKYSVIATGLAKKSVNIVSSTIQINYSDALGANRVIKSIGPLLQIPEETKPPSFNM